MWMDVAVQALLKGRVLEFRYSGYSRWVEVHAVGATGRGHRVMRCWQVRGGGVRSEPTGWKLMRTDDAIGAYVTEERSMAPRNGYRRDDRAMIAIVAQV